MSSVRKGTTKRCCYGVCRSGSTRRKTIDMENSYYFINFPKPCISYRRGTLNSTKQQHIDKCLKCAKSDLWVKSCGRRDGRFQSIDHITKNTFICSLHFDIKSDATNKYRDSTNKYRGPIMEHPDPISRFKRKTYNKATRSRTTLAAEFKQTKDSKAENMDIKVAQNAASNVKDTAATTTVSGGNKIYMYYNDNNVTCNQAVTYKNPMTTKDKVIPASSDCYVQYKSPSYKYCIVPMCTSTTIHTPDKHFFSVPKVDAVRRKWCNLMKRDEINYKQLSRKSSLYCCEDHFDLENDLENYVKYKLMGGLLKLKKDVVPHKFHCQSQVDKLKEDSLPDFRKRKNLILRDSDVIENKKSTPEKPSIGQIMHTNNHIEAVSTYVNQAVVKTEVIPEVSYFHGTELTAGNRSNDLATKRKFTDTSSNIQNEQVDPNIFLYLYNPGVTPSENVPIILQSKQKRSRKQQLNLRNDYHEVEELADENIEELADDVLVIKSEMDIENVDGNVEGILSPDKIVEIKKEIDDEIGEDNNGNVEELADEALEIKKEMDGENVEELADDIVIVKEEINVGNVEDIGNENVEEFLDDNDVKVQEEMQVGIFVDSSNENVDKFADNIVKVKEEMC